MIAMKRSFIGVQRYIAFRSPSAKGGRALYSMAKARVNPGEGFREAAMEDVSSFGREMIFHHRTGPFRRSAEGRLHEVTLRADENGYVLFRIFKGDIKTKQPAPVDGLHSPLRMVKFADCK